MTKHLTTQYTIVSLLETYEQFNEMVEKMGVYDFSFSLSSFGDLMTDVVGTIIPGRPIDTKSSALYKTAIYIGDRDAESVFELLQQYIKDQMLYLGLPLYPAPGFKYRYYLTGDLNLHFYYEPYRIEDTITNTYTRDDILRCIENGDYISEKLRQQYGIP